MKKEQQLIFELCKYKNADPLTYDGVYYTGFRPLRKNYSIVATAGEVWNIECKHVKRLITKFYAGELPFKEEVISYQDSVDGYNIIRAWSAEGVK